MLPSQHIWQCTVMCYTHMMRGGFKLTVLTVLKAAANTFHVAILFCNAHVQCR